MLDHEFCCGVTWSNLVSIVSILISGTALIVACGRLQYAKKTYFAANYPTPLVTIVDIGESGRLGIYLENPHNVAIADVQISATLAGSRRIALLKPPKRYHLLEITTEIIRHGPRILLGTTPDFRAFVAERFPDILIKKEWEHQALAYHEVADARPLLMEVATSYTPVLPDGRRCSQVTRLHVRPFISQHPAHAGRKVLQNWNTTHLTRRTRVR